LPRFMNSEILSTLKTVCTAGHAREGYDCNSNDQLEQLADMGLLVVSHAPRMLQRRAYRPTEKGWEMYKQITDKDVA